MAKRIIKLNDYESIRDKFSSLIKEWNGINMVLDNPTPLSYPYLNDADYKKKHGNSTFIDKQYRDKKYISFRNSSDRHGEFSTPGEDSFDITSGFYLLKVLGAGSGGHTCYTAGGNGKGGNSCACSMAGASGAYGEIIIFIPQNGTLTYKIGSGGQKEVTKTASNGNTTGSNIQQGQPTEIYFNNHLIISAGGGGYTRFYTQKAKKNKLGGKHKTNHTITGVYYNNQGTVINNAYVFKIINMQNSKWAERHTGYYIEQCPRTYAVEDIDYGYGGSSKAIPGNLNSSIENTENGGSGYFKIDSIDVSEYDYLDEIIPVESYKIHTLGNENNIRRKMSNSFDVMYNKLKNYGFYNEEGCYTLGEDYTGSTTAKPFNQLSLEKDPLTVVKSDGTTEISEVKSHRPYGCLPIDDYVITYDIDKKKKLDIVSYENFIDDESDSVMLMYEYNGDIIYIKDLNSESVDVYRYNQTTNKFIKVGVGTYLEQELKQIFNSHTGGETKTYNINNGAIVTVTLVGAGGGSGGGSWRDRWKTAGAGGGSGGALKASFYVKNGTATFTVGKAGIGGTLEKTGGGLGAAGTPSTFYFNNIEMATAGGGGGGQGSFKKNNYPPYPRTGSAGINRLNETIVSDVIYNINGKGGVQSSNYLYGELSVYNGTDYGAGGNARAKNSGLPGVDGYVNVTIKEDKQLIFNGHIYTPYNGVFPYSGVILNSDREYLIDRLDAIEKYLKPSRSFFDSQGYCQRSCQINCQTTVQRK